MDQGFSAKVRHKKTTLSLDKVKEDDDKPTNPKQ